MKRTLILLLMLCNKISYSQIEQKYYGTSKYANFVYVKIIHDTAYVDVIYEEKVPYFFYSDTLIYCKEKLLYQKGNYLTINQNKNKLLVTFPIIDNDGKIQKNIMITITLKESAKQYDIDCNTNKNICLLNQLYELQIEPYIGTSLSKNVVGIYDTLEKKYNINSEMIQNTKHSEFIVIFKEFELELINEIEKLKVAN